MVSARRNPTPEFYLPMKTARNLFLVLAALTLGSVSRAQVKVGDNFPAIKGAANEAVSQIDGKVAIVDFWASWCAPCKASFPAYARLYSVYAPKGLVILAMSVDDDPTDYARFVKRFSPGFPVSLDQGHQLVRQVSVPTMPTCYVMDRGGRVRFIHAGYHGTATDDALQKEVELLLSEK